MLDDSSALNVVRLLVLQEGAAKAASGEAVKCLACQGKRVRAPSQAAINAAILAAQRAAGLAPAAEDEDSDEYSEEEEEEEESGSSDEEQGSAGAAGGGEDKKAPGAAAGGAKPVQQAQQVPAATKVLSPLDSLLAELAKAAGVSVHTESSWMDAVLRVLIKVRTLWWSGAQPLRRRQLVPCCANAKLGLHVPPHAAEHTEGQTALTSWAGWHPNPTLGRCCAWTAPLSSASRWT